MAKRSTASSARGRKLDLANDDEVLAAGRTALEQRLGLAGTARFVRLLSGPRDRFEDLRRAWAGLSVAEMVKEIKQKTAK